MKVVHPFYNPTMGLWLTDNGVQAKSLAELQTKLGLKAKIEGYYPDGYKPPKDTTPQEKFARHPVITPPTNEQKRLHIKKLQENKRKRSMVSIPSMASTKVVPKAVPKTGPLQKRYDHNLVLDLWKEGVNTELIAERIQAPNIQTVMDIIRSARRRHDPRATSRRSRSAEDWMPEDSRRLWDLMARYSLDQVAKIMKLTRGTVAGRYFRLKKKVQQEGTVKVLGS